MRLATEWMLWGCLVLLTGCLGSRSWALEGSEEVTHLLMSRSDTDGAKIFRAYIQSRNRSAPLARPDIPTASTDWALPDTRATKNYRPSASAWDGPGTTWIISRDGLLSIDGMDELDARVFEDIGQGMLVLQVRVKKKWVDLVYQAAPPLPVDPGDPAFHAVENSLSARSMVWRIRLMSAEAFIAQAAAAEQAAVDRAARPIQAVMMTMSAPRTMQDELDVILSLHGERGTLLHLDFEAAAGAYYYIETCTNLAAATPDWITREILTPDTGPCTWERRPTYAGRKMSFRVLEHDKTYPLDADGDGMDDLTELSIPGRYPLDRDEDSIPDATEVELGGDPDTPNPVVVAGPNELSIQRKSISTERPISGFPGRTFSGHFYLSLTGSRRYAQNKVGGDSLLREDDYSFTYDLPTGITTATPDCLLTIKDYVDPGSCLVTQYDHTTVDFMSYHLGEDLWYAPELFLPEYIQVETDSYFLAEYVEYFGPGNAFTCTGQIPVSNRELRKEWEEFLLNPVTDEDLLQAARWDLNRCVNFDDLDWSTGFVVDADLPDPCDFTPIASALKPATHHVTTSPKSVELAHMQYRLELTAPQAGTYYRATLLEVFTPDDPVAASSSETYRLLFFADQQTQYVGIDDAGGSYATISSDSDSNDFSIDSPAEEGLCDVIILSVELDPSWDIVDEGDASEAFEAVVMPSGLSGLTYEWSWSAPGGAGNNPNVVFGAPNASETVVNGAHWYALPDDVCDANQVSDYTLTCTVSLNGQEVCSADATLSVSLIDPSGYTTPPLLQGFPAIAFNSTSGVYYVSGVGTLSRIPADVDIHLTTGSEFIAKTEAHENKHKQDFDNGYDGHEFVTVSEFYARIESFTDATQTGLVAKVSNEAQAYAQDEADEIESLRDCLEVRAYQVSDPIAPQYYYHNCGQYTCP